MKLRLKTSSVLIWSLLLLRAASGVTANLSYLLVAIYAFRSRGHAIEALFLSFVFTNLNTDMFPYASLADLARYLVVLAAFISVFGRDLIGRQSRIDRVSTTVLMFSSFALLHSLLFSLFPTVSFLKVVVWTLAILTSVRAWSTINNTTRDRVERRVYFALCLIVLFSLLSTINPNAYLPRTSLLRGVLNHSQALGSVAVIVAVWSFMRVTREVRPSWTDLCIFSIATLTIMSSGTRTALITLVLTVFIVGIMALIKIGRVNLRALIGIRSWRFSLFALMSVLLLAFQFDVIRDVLTKSTGTNANLVQLYELSRGGLIGEMWTNISSDPFIGLGFGIASNPAEMNVSYAGGIPIGAVVEKGVTLLAVWEELGILGFILFLSLLVVVFFRSINAETERVAVLIAILLINFGEASLMSAGGIGLVQIVLLGWIVSSGRTMSVSASSRQDRTL